MSSLSKGKALWFGIILDVWSLNGFLPFAVLDKIWQQTQRNQNRVARRNSFAKVEDFQYPLDSTCTTCLVPFVHLAKTHLTALEILCNTLPIQFESALQYPLHSMLCCWMFEGFHVGVSRTRILKGFPKLAKLVVLRAIFFQRRLAVRHYMPFQLCLFFLAINPFSFHLLYLLYLLSFSFYHLYPSLSISCLNFLVLQGSGSRNGLASPLCGL